MKNSNVNLTNVLGNTKVYGSVQNEYIMPDMFFQIIEDVLGVEPRTETLLEDIFPAENTFGLTEEQCLEMALNGDVEYTVSNHINRSGIDLGQMVKPSKNFMKINIIKANTRTGLGLAASTNYMKQLNTSKRDNGKYYSRKVRSKDMYIIFFKNGKPVPGFSGEHMVSVERLVKALNDGDEINIVADAYTVIVRSSAVPVMNNKTIAPNWLWEANQVGRNQRKRLKKQMRQWPMIDIEMVKGKVKPDLVTKFEETLGYFEEELISLESKDLMRVLEAVNLKFKDYDQFLFQTIDADGNITTDTENVYIPHAASVSLTRQGNTYLICIPAVQRAVTQGAIRALIKKFPEDITLNNGDLKISRNLFMKDSKYSKLVREMMAVGTMKYHEIMLEGNYIGLYADIQSTLLADIETYQRVGKSQEEINALLNTYWYLVIAGIIEIDRVKKQLPVDGLIGFLEFVRNPRLIRGERHFNQLQKDWGVDLSTILVKNGSNYGLSLDGTLKKVKGEESKEEKVRANTRAHMAITDMQDFINGLMENTTEEYTEQQKITNLFEELELEEFRIPLLTLSTILRKMNDRNAALAGIRSNAFESIINHVDVDKTRLNKLLSQNATETQLVKIFGHLNPEANANYLAAQKMISSAKKTDYVAVITEADRIGMDVKWADTINERDLYVALMYNLYNAGLDEKKFDAQRITIRQLLPKGAASIEG